MDKARPSTLERLGTRDDVIQTSFCAEVTRLILLETSLTRTSNFVDWGLPGFAHLPNRTLTQIQYDTLPSVTAPCRAHDSLTFLTLRGNTDHIPDTPGVEANDGSCLTGSEENQPMEGVEPTKITNSTCFKAPRQSITKSRRSL